jgi:glycogen(starch) synthase
VNILLTSHRFFPDVGGTETVTELLAEEFSKAGHKTVVVTQAIGGARLPSGRIPYQIVRRPNLRTLFRLYLWCDVVLQIQIGLQTAWPLIFIRRPWVISHHNWMQKGPRAWLKRRVLPLAWNVAASQALANRLPIRAKVIPNPYRKEVFRAPIHQARQKDLIFVGRLIRGKGVHVLIEGLRELERRGIRRELTVVGEGPALAELSRAGEGLSIEFVGARRGSELSNLLANHRLLVVPSIDAEPFGIVVIEGLACGCGVVASRTGGLTEAVGKHGVLCEPGDPKSLASAILEADATSGLMKGVAEHLSRHDPESVAGEYLKALEAAITEQ